MSVPIVGLFKCRAHILAEYGSHTSRMFLGYAEPSDQRQGQRFVPFANVMGVDRSE